MWNLIGAFFWVLQCIIW